MSELMTLIVSSLLIYFLGASIGSFLMVVLRRNHAGKTWVKGKSVCESCGKELHWWEMIPSFSYIFLGGKCSKCKSKIDPSHFIGETGLGVIFTLLFLAVILWNLPIKTAVVYIIALAVLWKNVMSDLMYKEVSSLEVWVAAFGISVITGCWFSTLIMIVIDAALTYKDNFKYFGAGDVDIIILIYAIFGGGLIGLYKIIDVLLFASMVALIVYCLYIRKSEDKRIPFVPFLFCGVVITLLGAAPL